MHPQYRDSGKPEMTLTGANRKGLTTRDGLWLVLAVMAHVAFLLVPIRMDQPPDSAEQPVLIELQMIARTTPPPPPPQEPIPGPEAKSPAPPPMEPEPAESLSRQEPGPDVVMEEDITPPAEPLAPEEAEPIVTTAVLMQSAIDRDWLLNANEPDRTLGVFVPQAVPENWLPGITLEENRFDGMTVPRKVEIVDRWISTDGSQNVVINTPSGETLCGTGLAWNPMQPLVEHVMQFRLCGGGGKRTFDIPDRYHRNYDRDGIANSTTN